MRSALWLQMCSVSENRCVGVCVVLCVTKCVILSRCVVHYRSRCVPACSAVD